MLLQNATHDLRFAVAPAAQGYPGFTVLAVGTLALGSPPTLTIFSWINSTLLNPIPGVAHTSDMITIMRGERSEHPTPPFSYLDYADLRGSTHSFSGLLGLSRRLHGHYRLEPAGAHLRRAGLVELF